jgi:effector-binding domain-containing protein
MKKYFVKAIFSGWHEVSEENYNRFCDNIRRNATGIKSEEKEAYILTVTRIETTEI